MKRKTKRALSMVLASSMMLSVSSYTAFGASFRDTTGHWAENQVNIWSDYGVINGYDGLFRPDDSITRGEMAVIMDKVMKYQVSAENTFNDLDKNFYTESILKANQAGIMRGSDGAVRPKDNITREEASVLICQAFGIDPVEESTSKFNDSDQVSSWAAGYVNALSQKGYISGKGNNNFDPKGNITRGEAVTMFNNIVKGFYHQAGTYTQNITGNVVVNTPDTTLKDMSVTGDIFITEGVGDGDLTLENVVASNVVVRGGGVNSIKIKGNSQIGNIRVEKKDSDVRVAVDGTAKVDSVYVKNGSKNSVLEGPLGKVEVASSDSIVRLTGATVKELNVTEKTAHVIIDEKSKVENINVAETAVNAVVEINGVVVNLNVNAASSSITTGSNSKIDNITVSEKATNVKLDIGGIVTNLTTAAQSTIMNIAQKAVVSTIKIFEKATNSALTVAGKVNSILVDAANAIIEVLKGGEVGTIESSSTATGLEVKGEGKVSSITIGGKDSKITVSNTHVKVEAGVTGTVVNGNDVAGGEDVTTGSGSDVTPGTVVNPGGQQTVDPTNPDDPENYDDDDEEEPQAQDAPEQTWFEGAKPSNPDNNDGSIILKDTSVDTSTLQYKLDKVADGVNGEAWSDYVDWDDKTNGQLLPGTYSIRFKEKEGYLASEAITVEVPVFEYYRLKDAVDNITLSEELENGISKDNIKEAVKGYIKDTKKEIIDLNVFYLRNETLQSVPMSIDVDSIEWGDLEPKYDSTEGSHGEFTLKGTLTVTLPTDITTSDGKTIPLYDIDGKTDKGTLDIYAHIDVKKNEDKQYIKDAQDLLANEKLILPVGTNNKANDVDSILTSDAFKAKILAKIDSISPGRFEIISITSTPEEKGYAGTALIKLKLPGAEGEATISYEINRNVYSLKIAKVGLGSEGLQLYGGLLYDDDGNELAQEVSSENAAAIVWVTDEFGSHWLYTSIEGGQFEFGLVTYPSDSRYIVSTDSDAMSLLESISNDDPENASPDFGDNSSLVFDGTF